jgi:hypothetical protein
VVNPQAARAAASWVHPRCQGDSNIDLRPVTWLRVDRKDPIHKPYPFPNADYAKPALVRQQAGIEPRAVIGD